MANVILDHFVHLKQSASDYLSQIYQLSFELQDLKEALEKLLDIIRKSLKSSHDCHDRGDIPSMRQESIAKAMRVEEPTIGVR
jgi:archaellum component FlaC